MGGLSIWHWIILLLIVVVPLALIGGLVWLVVHLSGRKPVPASVSRMPPASMPSLTDNIDTRLSKLRVLVENGHITQDEYDRQRAAIISGV